MIPTNAKFQGSRLREALDARAITATSLAHMLGVSKGAVSQYISGLHAPSPTVMARICAILNLPAHFFTTPSQGEDSPHLFWRSRASATKTARNTIGRRYNWFRRAVNFIENFVELPPPNFPSFDPPSDPTLLRPSEVDELATLARRHWKLGDGPISSVVGLFENNGTVVVRNEMGDDRLDAFSDWDSFRCYMVLGTDKESAVRSRHDAAHELAHTILHRNVPETLRNQMPIHNLMEKQAESFASAFLLPATTFPSEVYAPSLQSLLQLKMRWRVSVASMVMRLSELGVIGEERKTRLFIDMSRKGWRKREPLDDKLEPEQPKLIQRAVDLLLDNGLTRLEEMELHTHLNQSDLERLLGLGEGYLSEPAASFKLFVQPRKDQDAGSAG